MAIIMVHKVRYAKGDGWSYDALVKVLYRDNPGRGSQYVSDKQERMLYVMREERERLAQATRDISDLIQIILEDTGDS